MPRFSGQIENVESRRVPDEGVIGSDGGSARSARDHLRPRPDRRERGFETALAVNATHVVHRESLGTMGGPIQPIVPGGAHQRRARRERSLTLGLPPSAWSRGYRRAGTCGSRPR